MEEKIIDHATDNLNEIIYEFGDLVEQIETGIMDRRPMQDVLAE
jgi:hypothetical protein